MVADVGAVGYFLPIFAFLLVFIVIYALLVKTKVLGGNHGVMVFVSLIMSSFFIVRASLVEFVRFSSAWFSVGAVLIFFLIALLGFLPGKEPWAFLGAGKSNWFSWVVLGIIVIFFISSSSYVFNWAVSWETVRAWANTSWFGLILLLIIAAVVSWKIKG